MMTLGCPLVASSEEGKLAVTVEVGIESILVRVVMKLMSDCILWDIHT